MVIKILLGVRGGCDPETSQLTPIVLCSPSHSFLFVFRFGTSAKENSNIEDAARFLLEEIMNREAELSQETGHDPERIQLNQPRAKEGCC